MTQYGSAGNAHNRRELWLAEDRNYLMVRALAYTLAISHDVPDAEFVVTEFQEIAPGVWFPYAGRQSAYDKIILARSGQQRLRWRGDISVESASLNPAHDISYFRDIDFPAGTAMYEVKDGRIRHDYRIGAPDGSAGFYAMLRAWWIVILNLFVALVAGALLWRNRHRSCAAHAREPVGAQDALHARQGSARLSILALVILGAAAAAALVYRIGPAGGITGADTDASGINLREIRKGMSATDVARYCDCPEQHFLLAIDTAGDATLFLPIYARPNIYCVTLAFPRGQSMESLYSAASAAVRIYRLAPTPNDYVARIPEAMARAKIRAGRSPSASDGTPSSVELQYADDFFCLWKERHGDIEFDYDVVHADPPLSGAETSEQ